MGRKSTRQEITLSDEERELLKDVIRNLWSFQKHIWRARIGLELGSGCGLVETTQRTNGIRIDLRFWACFFRTPQAIDLKHFATL